MELVKNYTLQITADIYLESERTILVEARANTGLLERRFVSGYDVRKTSGRAAPINIDGTAVVSASALACYDALRRVIAAIPILYESAGLWGATVFIFGADTVHFKTAPLRASSSVPSVSQPSGRDTEGTFYAYTKSTKTRTMHTLKFITNKAVLDDLIYLHSTATKGSKTAFTWTDHNNSNHVVHFSSTDIPWKRTGPDRYEVTVQLREDGYL